MDQEPCQVEEQDWARLPGLVLQRLSTLLSHKAVIAASQTCKQWHDVLSAVQPEVFLMPQIRGAAKRVPVHERFRPHLFAQDTIAVIPVQQQFMSEYDEEEFADFSKMLSDHGQSKLAVVWQVDRTDALEAYRHSNAAYYALFNPLQPVMLSLVSHGLPHVLRSLSFRVDSLPHPTAFRSLTALYGLEELNIQGSQTAILEPGHLDQIIVLTQLKSLELSASWRLNRRVDHNHDPEDHDQAPGDVWGQPPADNNGADAPEGAQDAVLDNLPLQNWHAQDNVITCLNELEGLTRLVVKDLMSTKLERAVNSGNDQEGGPYIPWPENDSRSPRVQLELQGLIKLKELHVRNVHLDLSRHVHPGLARFSSDQFMMHAQWDALRNFEKLEDLEVFGVVHYKDPFRDIVRLQDGLSIRLHDGSGIVVPYKPCPKGHKNRYQPIAARRKMQEAPQDATTDRQAMIDMYLRLHTLQYVSQMRSLVKLVLDFDGPRWGCGARTGPCSAESSVAVRNFCRFCIEIDGYIYTSAERAAALMQYRPAMAQLDNLQEFKCKCKGGEFTLDDQFLISMQQPWSKLTSLEFEGAVLLTHPAGMAVLGQYCNLRRLVLRHCEVPVRGQEDANEVVIATATLPPRLVHLDASNASILHTPGSLPQLAHLQLGAKCRWITNLGERTSSDGRPASSAGGMAAAMTNAPATAAAGQTGSLQGAANGTAVLVSSSGCVLQEPWRLVQLNLLTSLDIAELALEQADLALLLGSCGEVLRKLTFAPQETSMIGPAQLVATVAEHAGSINYLGLRLAYRTLLSWPEGTVKELAAAATSANVSAVAEVIADMALAPATADSQAATRYSTSHEQQRAADTAPVAKATGAFNQLRTLELDVRAMPTTPPPYEANNAAAAALAAAMDAVDGGMPLHEAIGPGGMFDPLNFVPPPLPPVVPLAVSADAISGLLQSVPLQCLRLKGRAWSGCKAVIDEAAWNVYPRCRVEFEP